MTSNKTNWLVLGIFVVIAALIYLPLVNKMGLYNDDWYLMYDAHTQGAQFFHEIYSIDRPARGYVMQAAYTLFGDHILYYHLSAWLFRVLSAWALFWALGMIWNREERSNFLASLLFLIYPGFLSQINPIDYQSQILSLCLAMLSIAFTLRSILSNGLSRKLSWFGLAVITGIIYPALVEYFIGLEILRLGLIAVLVLQEDHANLKETIRKILYRWVPFLTAPLAFLVWRLFFFTSERGATDVGSQLGQLFSSPLTGLRWLVNLTQDTIRVVFLAWSVPLNILGFDLRLGDTLIGLALAAVVGSLAAAAYSGKPVFAAQKMETGADNTWGGQFLVTGIVSAIFALLPVILANRHADFNDYSRYALASSAGAGMVITVLISSLNSPRLRSLLVAFLVFVACYVHYANAVRAVQVTETIQEFWWQVSWRVPDIKPGTTLVASYPGVGIQEDYFVWGPANLIYSPTKQNTMPIEIRLPAAVLTGDVVDRILAGNGEETPLRRGNALTRTFGNVLVLTQSDGNSCVRILDGNNPDLSALDIERVMLIAPKSKLENVIAQGESPELPVSFFGKEPAHEWCYYYEKADLARQQGNWQLVAQLGDEVQKLGLHPNDQIEWMPFLQAYAILGNQKEVKGISTRINTEPFYQHLACENLNAMTASGITLSPDMQNSIQELFCKQ